MKPRMLLGAFVSTLALVSMTRLAGAQTSEPSPPSSTAPEAIQASSRFRRGVELFRDGDFQAALSEFRRAYEIQKNYRVMYNIGQCFVKLREPANAIRAFTQYLSEGSSDVPKERRGQVELELGGLAKRVARVAIYSDVAGAEVFVDDERVGVTPLAEATIIGVGRHRVIASYGGKAQVKPLDLAAGDDVEVAFTIGNAVEKAPPPTPRVGTRAESSTGRSSLVWFGWAGTGFLAAGAITTGILALDARSAAEESLARFGADAGSVDSERSRMQTLATASDILSVAALVAGGVSLYLTLRRDPKAVAHPGAASAGRGRPGWSW